MELDELAKYILTPASQVAIIMAIAEMVKAIDIFDKKYIPVLDLVLGLISGILVFWLILGQDFLVSIVIGVALGLSACGLFSGIKNVTK